MISTALALGSVIGTVAVVTILGLWYARGRVGSVEDYITARNSTGSGATTATLIASGMGAWILLSPAEAGAAFGGLSAVVGYAVGSALPMLAYVALGPRIRELIPEGHTLTEYALARYGPAMYGFVLFVSGFYMFVFLASEMTGVASALHVLAGIPEWQTASLVGLSVLLYTGYGGLRASIFTDTVQTLLILPLMAVGLGGAVLALGGTGAIYRDVATANPSLLDPGFLPGVQFGVYVAVAILGAELLNQSWWQRIYAAESARTLRRAFAVTAVAVVPMILLAGLFGLVAAGLDLVVTDLAAPGYNADVAFFLVVARSFPTPVVLAVIVLAVLLVTSTADTLFNAIASIVTADLPRVLDDPDQRTLTLAARALTVLVAAGAVAIGSQGYSVLQLFFTADLVAVATFVPLLAGLYTPRLGGPAALVSSLAGLVAGLVYFPTLRGAVAAMPGVGPLLPATGFFSAFVGAALVAAGLTAAFAALGTGDYDLGRLSREVTALDDGVASDGGER
ncbi:MAG: sodium:proline symporter [Haloarculaceae archaeon]